MYEYPDIAKLTMPLKRLCCAMAARGWTDVPDGFSIDLGAIGARTELTTDRLIKQALTKEFPTAAWEGHRMTLTGEPARAFMALYRRAAGGV